MKIFDAIYRMNQYYIFNDDDYLLFNNSSENKIGQ